VGTPIGEGNERGDFAWASFPGLGITVGAEFVFQIETSLKGGLFVCRLMLGCSCTGALAESTEELVFAAFSQPLHTSPQMTRAMSARPTILRNRSFMGIQLYLFMSAKSCQTQRSQAGSIRLEPPTVRRVPAWLA
jgi:hypothetical protein